MTEQKTFEDRIALAISDPGSIVKRRDGESVARWGARAVLHTIATHGEASRRTEVALASRLGDDGQPVAFIVGPDFQSLYPGYADEMREVFPGAVPVRRDVRRWGYVETALWEPDPTPRLTVLRDALRGPS